MLLPSCPDGPASGRPFASEDAGPAADPCWVSTPVAGIFLINSANCSTGWTLSGPCQCRSRTLCRDYQDQNYFRAALCIIVHARAHFLHRSTVPHAMQVFHFALPAAPPVCTAPFCHAPPVQGWARRLLYTLLTSFRVKQRTSARSKRLDCHGQKEQREQSSPRGKIVPVALP
eukprot:266898-Rhodomonas_salina.2